MSDPSGTIGDMELTTIVVLVIGLVLGVVLGAFAMSRITEARRRAEENAAAADASEARAELAEAKRDAASARESAAQARQENSELRELRAEAKADTEQARSQVAEARSEAAQARADLSEVQARLAGMSAERDAAVARADQLAKDRESLVNQFKVLSGESLERQGKSADATAEARLKRTEEVLAPLQEMIRTYESRLTAVEKERASMATDLRNQVQAVQLTGEHLRRETQALATALRKPQVRGAWGEMHLRRVAEFAGMVEQCDFDLQTSTVTSADQRIRPDMRVNLTNGRHVFVDAKVPLSAFLEAHEATDETTREAKLALFGKNVRAHIDQLGGKEYWKADAGTPEFVVLFLPNESFLLAALEQQPDLHEYAANRSIVIGTPNTLIAMLRAVAYGWKQVDLANETATVIELGRELHSRLRIMGNHVEKTGRSLTSAVEAYNKMVGSLESRVMVTARRFTDMKVSDEELSELKQIGVPTRGLTSAEFEDANTLLELPERSELSRRDPDADELIGESDLAQRSHRNDGHHGQPLRDGRRRLG